MSGEEVSTTRVRLSGLDDLVDGEGTRIDVEGRRIAVVRCGDAVHAIGDRCSHANYSLAEGDVDPDDLTIECWKHGALFSLCDGQPLTLPAIRPVPVYPVEVVDGEVWVTLDEESS